MIWVLVYLSFSLLLCLGYALLQSLYYHEWKDCKEWNLPAGYEPQTRISVIIPARNEAENIIACLQAVLRQEYPRHLYEVLVIDDHSEDRTAALVRNFKHPQIRLLSLADHLSPQEKIIAYKKKAIELGIRQAQGDLIVTTDADCEMGVQWLLQLAGFYELTSAKFIAAPVNFYEESNPLEYYQSLDFTGMMGITAAGIQGRFMHMCNGANVAYEKSAFTAVDGFRGIDDRASGDDMLLMQKIAKKYPGSLGFVKSQQAVVYTRAQASWQAFLRQRIRWASKSGDYEEWKATVMLAIVFFFCFNLLANALLLPWLGLLGLAVLLLQFAVKCWMDYRLLHSTATFFQRKDLLRHFFLAQFWHIGYIVSVGILANMQKTYRWKGRVTR